MADIIRVHPPDRREEFCSLLLRADQYTRGASPRIRNPVAFQLGVDLTTEGRLLKRMDKYLADRTDDPALDLVYYLDTDIETVTGASDPVSRDLLRQLTDTPVLIHSDMYPMMTCEPDQVIVSIGTDGVTWIARMGADTYQTPVLPHGTFVRPKYSSIVTDIGDASA